MSLLKSLAATCRAGVRDTPEQKGQTGNDLGA